MADTAVHLERFVLPAVHVRHGICSLPWGLRALLGYDRKLCAAVVSAFVNELSRSLRARAKCAFGLPSVAAAHTGAVAAIQRTDSALRLNVHAHVLALDGVYVRDERTITRPPFSQDRLELRADGRVELTLKRVWRDGTRAVVYEPLDFLARLIAAIPPPKFQLLRYFGVLASHSALRSEVVPLPPDEPDSATPSARPGRSAGARALRA